ncbi:ATP-binding protein [Caulobacter sp. RL271]|uniref:histidine kinase n=1 Tax=Caulobacter segnis TaxID=88688 RepID=A0ABY4ZMP5_9CAUL|nr:ATP-binding protein [Caulobacter segnis]USQ93820.1 response regulator [Caulobacter segnis]
MSRRKQVSLRLFVVLVLAALALVKPGMNFVFGWSVLYLIVQVSEILALNNFLRRAKPGRGTVTLNLLADFALAVVFGWLAIPVWATGTPVGAAGAVLLLSGSIITALMGAEGCLTAFAASATPHLAYVLITPLVAGGIHDPVMPFFTAGVGLFCLTVALVFLWSRRTLEAERAARRAAEAQTAAKSAFVAMVSHELRTPINAILNGAEALDGGRAGASGADASLIADAGTMMRALLNDLLDLSKIEAGRMGVEVVDHDLRALVTDALDFWRKAAEAKGVSLELEGVERLPQWVRGDPMRVRQVLNNLLSNAIKFTAEGAVTVGIRVKGPEMIGIDVRDTGPGLSEDQIGRLFSPYEQLGVETARAFGGTGLGLAISRDLARLMGGELTAANTAEGGARFTLRLPTPAGVAPPPPEAHEVEVLAVRDDAPLILVVDDHDINRRALRQMLEAFGARVETAEDALTALAMAERRVFDAILMDVRMPGVDGLEATRRLRASRANRATPVIAVTGAVSPEEVAACREAGMTGWVEKPVNARDLYAALFE